MSEERQRGLHVCRDGDRIVISIGIGALKTATEAAPQWEHLEIGPVVTDVEEWAKSILWALNDEREDGTTLVHLMFDEAMEKASESGELGIEFPPQPVFVEDDESQIEPLQDRGE